MLFCLATLLICLSLCNGQIVNELSCNFDNGDICDYTMIGGDGWRIKNAGYHPSQTINGPEAEALYSSSFLQLVSNNSAIESPIVSLNGDHCLSFDYYRFGDGDEDQNRIDIVARVVFNDTNFFDYSLFYADRSVGELDGWQHVDKTFSVYLSATKILSKPRRRLLTRLPLII